MLIDTHAHIYSNEFNHDLELVIRRAHDEGIKKILIPNVDKETIPQVINLKNKFPQTCYPMIGIHPTSINENYQQELNAVNEYLQKHKFIAIGEIGIDLYWDKTFIEEQKKAFAQQIQWAKQYNLPIAIHCRNAFNETMEVLLDNNNKDVKGVFHSFSGNIEQAQKVISLGFKIGVSGVVTFKNSGQDKVIAQIPLEHLLLETDAPYLTPAPFRGKRNESAYISIIAKKIAELKNITFEEVAEITTKNTLELFKL